MVNLLNWSNLGFLCLGNPDYFKSETQDARQIITSSLRDGSLILKRTILEVFKDYFAIEEQKSEAREGKMKEDVDLDADISVLTGTAKTTANDEYVSLYISNIRVSFFLAGNYTDDIIACALSDSQPLAILGIEVLDLIINAGLGAPHHWFPTLVALETSPVPRVHNIASRVRVKAVERYEHVIDGVYLDGMQKMFTYQKTVLDSIKGAFPRRC